MRPRARRERCNRATFLSNMFHLLPHVGDCSRHGSAYRFADRNGCWPRPSARAPRLASQVTRTRDLANACSSLLLGLFAHDAFVRILDTLALVGLGRADTTHLRGDMPD